MTLTPNDLQQIDNEILARAGKGKRREVMERLRTTAELHRVYANRAANMCREIQDERNNHVVEF